MEIMSRDRDVISSWRAGTAGLLDLSAAAIADGDFACFHDHRNLAAAVGNFQHALQARWVFKHVDILERNLATGEIRTGSRGVGSKVLAKNFYFVIFHGIPPSKIEIARADIAFIIRRRSAKLQPSHSLC